MNKSSIVFVGIGGYGNTVLNLILDFVKEEDYVVTGIVDPVASKAPMYGWACKQNIPLYNTIEEYYREKKADLAIICSPISFHKQQILTALKNGSNVLCEKPLVPVIQDVEEIEAAIQESGKKLGVGFQWSFTPTMLAIKRDILNGKLGKPLFMKTYVSWRRYDQYYQNSWKGNLRDQEGNWLLDSIATNATSHYLHNIFFLLGDSINTAKMPTAIRASVYRIKEIETFDTCFMKGEFDNGAQFYYGVSHGGDIEDEPMFEYEFEHAVIRFNLDDKNSEVVATFRDGRKQSYGFPFSEEEVASKVNTMIQAAKGKAEIPCSVQTIVPHLKVCNALFENVEITKFESPNLYREQGAQTGLFVHGLYNEMMRCFQENKLPSEIGFDWAVKETVINPNEMNFFKGEKFRKG